MLEGVLARVIDRIAGKYVDGIDQKAANLSVWSGHIMLKDLSLKPSALDDLDLPVKLLYGHLQELSLDIPWNNLRSKPVIVRLSGLYIIVGPNTDASSTADAKRERELAAKRASIAYLDTLNPETAESDDKGEGSFTERFVNKIVNNIQIKVSSIHLRYEDSYTDSQKPFALGMMLKNFTAESTNEKWTPTFVERPPVLHKLINLEGLSLYLDSDLKSDGVSLSLLGPGYVKKMQDMVEAIGVDESASSADLETMMHAQERHDEEPSFLIKPIDGKLRLKLLQSKKPDNTTPQYDATVEMTRVALRLQKRQYRDVLRVLDFLSNHERIIRYNQFRPSHNVHSNPRAWWKFAYQCAVWEREQRLKRFDKQRIMRAVMLWPKYAKLYRMRFATVFDLPAISDDDRRTLQALEDELSYDAIVIARDVVHKQLREALKRQAEQQKQSPRPTTLYGRLSSWLPFSQSKSSPSSSPTKGGMHNATAVVSTSEATQRLMEEMGMEDDVVSNTDDDASAHPVDPETCLGLKIEFVLMRGSLTLVNNQEGKASEEIPIAMLSYKNLSMQVVTRATSMDFTLQLSNFVVTDLHTHDLAPGFHRIVSRHEKVDSSRVQGSSPSRVSPASTPASAVSAAASTLEWVRALAHARRGKRAASEDRESPLLWLKYESRPLDGKADSRLVVNMDRLNIIYSTGWLRALSGFIDIGSSSPALESLKRAAAEQLEEARKVSQRNVTVALREKLVFDLRLDLRSPLILIPQSLSRSVPDTDVLVLQPGNLSVWSLREHLAETSPLLQEMVAADDKEDKNYNTLLMELSDVSVFMSCRSTCWDTLPSSSSQALIHDIRVSICIDNSIVPDNADLTRTLVKVALPRLNLAFSQRKYHAILSILAAITSAPQHSPPQQEAAAKQQAPAEPFTRSPSNVPTRARSSSSVDSSSSRRPRASKEAEASHVQPPPLPLPPLSQSEQDHPDATAKRNKMAKWRLLDVVVSVAPTHAVSLELSREGTRGEEPIARFALRNMMCSYVQFADLCTSADVTVGSVEVEDVRPREANRFRRLVAPSGTDSHKLCCVQMSSDADGSVTYVASLGHVEIMCIPDAIVPILHVFDSPPPRQQALTADTVQKQDKPQDKVQDGAAEQTNRHGTQAVDREEKLSEISADLPDAKHVKGQERERVSDVHGMNKGMDQPGSHRDTDIRRPSVVSSTASSIAVVSNSVVGGAAPTSLPVQKQGMVAQLFLIAPRITLVEDCTDADSKRVSLQLSTMFKYQALPDGVQQARGHVQDLQVTVQGNEWEIKSPIIEPWSLSANCTIASNGGSDLWVTASPVDVWVAYMDLKLLTTISESMAAFTATPSKEANAGDKGAKDAPQDADKGAKDEPQDADQQEQQQQQQQAAVDSSRPPSVQSLRATKATPIAPKNVAAVVATHDWRFDCDCVKMTLINDCRGFNEPFAAVLMEGVRFQHTSTGEGNLQQSLRCQVSCSLFNNLVMEYEPALEDWPFRVENIVRPQSNGASPSQLIRVVSSEVLNVNVTEAHMDNMTSTLLLWRSDWGGSAVGGATKRRAQQGAGVYSAYIVRNHCGTRVCVKSFWKDGAQGVPPVNVDALQSVPFFFHDRMFKRHTSEMVERMKRARQDNSRQIYISLCADATDDGIEEAEQGFNVLVDKMGEVVGYRTRRGGRVIAEVTVGDGSTTHLLTISSCLSLSNACHQGVDVRVINADGDELLSLSLAPGARADIPPDMCCEDVLLMVKPALSPCTWSQAVAVTSDLDSVVRCAPMSDGSARTFHTRTVAQVKTLTTSKGALIETVSVCIMPVMVVSNLLPCPLTFSFLLDGDAGPLARSIVAASGQDVAIHDIDLSRKISIGASVEGLDAGSEFVPVFCPDGSPPETFICVYDEAHDALRLQLSHKQEPLEAFVVTVYAPYWFDNRTGFPLVYGQKWTASNVTLRGGQRDDGEGAKLVGQLPDPSCLKDVLGKEDKAPIPFSFGIKADLGGSKACVRLGKPFQRFSSRDNCSVPCEWSHPFAIDTVGSSVGIELQGDGFVVEVAAQVNLVPGRFFRSKMITLVPRYVVCNMLQQPIQLGQVGCEDASPTQIGHGEMQVLRWLDESKERDVRIRMLPDIDRGHEDWGWQWCDAISRSAMGYFPLKVRAKKTRADGSPQVFNLVVHSSLQGAVTIMVVRPQDPNNPSIQVTNSSCWATVGYRQAGIDVSLEEKASPHESHGYCWDKPQSINMLRLRVLSQEGAELAAFDCGMDRLGSFPPVRVGDRVLQVKVEAKGPTKVLLIEDGEGCVDAREGAGIATEGDDLTVAAGIAAGSSVVGSTHIAVCLAGIGVSVIDAEPTELLYVSLTCLVVDIVSAGDWQLTDVHVQRLQVDNQTSLGNPVLLGLAPANRDLSAVNPSPLPTPDRNLAEPIGADISSATTRAAVMSAVRDIDSTEADPADAGDQWFLSLKISKCLKNVSVDSFSSIDVTLKDLALDCDERLLVRLLGAFRGIIATLSRPSEDTQDKIAAVGAVDVFAVMCDRDASAMRWTYIERLRISPVRLFVTLNGSDDAHGLLRDLSISKLPFFAFVEAAKAMVTNIDRAPISLNKIDWEQPFLPREELISRITKHYRNSIVGGFYNLIGAFEFLGNPTGLVSNISSGLHDFIDFSREGIKEGRLGKGLAMGTGRLAAGTVQGVFGSAAGLSNAMGKGLAQLTFDGDYKRARALLDQHKPAHFGEGMLQGGRQFGKGIIQGVTGVVTQPIKGYNKDGARGAFKGLGKGLVGAVVKPMAGVADMVSQTTEGIRNTPEYISKRATLTRIRLPRVWERGSPVKGYDKRQAQGAAMLAKVSAAMGVVADDTLIDYVAWRDALFGPVTLFITTSRIILCSMVQRSPQSPFSSYKALRPIAVFPIDSILQLQEKGSAITLVGRQLTKPLHAHQCLPLCCRFHKSITHMCKLHVTDKGIREWLLQRLRAASRIEHCDLHGEDWTMVSVSEGEASDASCDDNVHSVEDLLQNAGDILRRAALSIARSEIRRGHAVYAVVCKLDGRSEDEEADNAKRWTVFRRYREFDRLHRQLLQSEAKDQGHTIAHDRTQNSIPPLPPKRWFGRTSATVTRERTQGLDLWLRKVQALCGSNEKHARLLGKFIFPRTINTSARR